MSVRTRAVGLAIAAAALAASVTALAGHEPGAVASYTGCLNTSSGTLANVAEGNVPAAACKDKETPIHLGGGDITGVAAGAGLTGGGTSGTISLAVDGSTVITGVHAGFGLTGGGSGGEVPLAVDPSVVQRRVSGSCASGAISAITENGSVTCHEGQSAKLVKVAGTVAVDEEEHEVASTPLPAGDWAVIASVSLHLFGDDGGAFCALRVNGITLDSQTFDFDEDDVEYAAGTLITDATLGAGGSASVACSMSNDDEGAFVGGEFGVRLLATRVDFS